MTGGEGILGGNVKPFRDFMYNTTGGRYLIFAALASALFAGAVAFNKYVVKDSASIVQQNVIGNQQPEIYIEKDGVKYFSHIDGKDISHLIDE